MHIQKPLRITGNFVEVLVNNNFLSTILLHAYVQYVYIMYTRYQIASSKAVVGVDRHIKALSMHIQKPLRITKGNNSHRISP